MPSIIEKFKKSSDYRNLVSTSEWTTWHVTNETTNPHFCIFEGLSVSKYTPQSVGDFLRAQYTTHTCQDVVWQKNPRKKDLWDCIIPMYRKADAKKGEGPIVRIL